MVVLCMANLLSSCTLMQHMYVPPFCWYWDPSPPPKKNKKKKKACPCFLCFNFTKEHAYMSLASTGVLLSDLKPKAQIGHRQAGGDRQPGLWWIDHGDARNLAVSEQSELGWERLEARTKKRGLVCFYKLINSCFQIPQTYHPRTEPSGPTRRANTRQFSLIIRQGVREGIRCQIRSLPSLTPCLL